MNFLVILLRLAVTLMLIFFAVFFGGREILLYMAGAQLVSDAHLLTIPQRWNEQTPQCISQFATGQPYDGFQLRFLDNREYALEVNCLVRGPVEWQRKSLPPLVKKTTGSAGFFYNFTSQDITGELTIELWGRQKMVYAEGKKTSQIWGSTQLRSAKPASVCSAHGLFCCDPELEVGEGELNSRGVTDCPGSCYQACLQRPILLSLQTDPFADYEQHRLRIAETSALVLFNFVYDDRQAPLESVKIDFGDGTTDELLGVRSGQFSKEYTCPTPTCSYTVRLRATDIRGVESPARRADTMLVELGVPPIQ